MATNVIKIIDSQDKVVSQTQVASGKSITVSAKEGQSYEFVSGATKRAPDEIKTTREGNNLKVEIKDGDATSTTIIEDYYTNGEGDLIGLAEDGHFYNFVPEEMGNDYMVTDLADGVSSFQALGSEGDSMSPWWLGLPLLALGAAGGGGGSGAANTLDTTAPDAPSNLTVEDNYNQTTLSVWGNDDDTGIWSFNSATGEWSVEGGNVNLVDGKIITNDSTPTLSGTGEAGTIVRVYDGDIDPADPTVNLVGETKVEDDGTWTLTTNELQAEEYNKPDIEDSGAQHVEHTLNITLTDTAGNVSDPASIDMIVDTLHTYKLGNLTFTNEDSDPIDPDLHRERLDNRTELNSNDNHYFTGAFTISDDFVKEDGANETEHISYQEGDEVYITLTNKETGEEYFIGGPNNPTTIVDGDSKWSITIDPTQLYYNKTTDTMETLSDGYYENQVIVREASGDISVYYTNGPSETYGDFGIDTVAPDKPVINQHLGGVTKSQSFYINVNSMDAISHYEYVSDYLFGDVKELLFYRDGSTDSVGSKTVSIDGTETTNWTDLASLDAEEVYMYQVKAVDVAGNESELSDKAWVIFDSDNSHNLTDVDDDSAKCFEEMILVGNSDSETFIVDNADFMSIDGRDGTDTFVLTGSGQELYITQTQDFEVYNINENTLTITDVAKVDGADDHIVINGISGIGQVDIDSAWTDMGTNTSIYDNVTGITHHYDVYIYTGVNGSDNLWVEQGLV